VEDVVSCSLESLLSVKGVGIGECKGVGISGARVLLLIKSVRTPFLETSAESFT
jgi:hypothetical protein